MKLFNMLIIGSLAFLSSCGCDCHCEKCPGCETVLVRKKSDSSLVIMKKYYSDINLNTNTELHDSVNAFTAKYYSDSAFITLPDSTGNCAPSINRINCRETSGFEAQGYGAIALNKATIQPL